MMAERENIPMMVEQLRGQSMRDFSVYICVNQEEGDAERFEDNQASLRMLREVDDLDIRLIDRSSKGLGWQGKQKGVGWARKVLMERIMEERGDDEWVVWLDADTEIADDYLETLAATLAEHGDWNALSVPYYHPLTGIQQQDRAMLRYECYMRHYLINLLLIASPYAFTALGSAMVFKLRAYRRVGGITPLQAGEDFYLMQKFAKTGVVGLHHTRCVFPQGRLSSRVPFGTGPAISKGIDSMDDSYPFYPEEAFGRVGETFALMPSLFDRDIPTPMTPFLQQQLRCDDLWGPLRKNFKTRELFAHACHEKVDGLRILQYLKTWPTTTGTKNLIDFCKNHGINVSPSLSFSESPLEELEALRKALFDWERSLRALHG